METKHRDLVTMAVLTILTIGIYFIYWAVKTKTELKHMGADIPTAFLIIIPFANIYFWYKYSVGYLTYVKKLSHDNNIIALCCISASFSPFFSMFAFQAGLNKLAKKV